MRSMSGREVVRAFEKAGFVLVRISSGHHILKRDGHPNTISVPVHGGKDVKKGTLRGIIRASGLTNEQFEEFAK